MRIPCWPRRTLRSLGRKAETSSVATGRRRVRRGKLESSFVRALASRLICPSGNQVLAGGRGASPRPTIQSWPTELGRCPLRKSAFMKLFCSHLRSCVLLESLLGDISLPQKGPRRLAEKIAKKLCCGFDCRSKSLFFISRKGDRQPKAARVFS